MNGNLNGTPNLTAHLIGLLKAPPSVPIQAQEINKIDSTQNYLPLTLPHEDSEPGPAHSRSISDDSEFSSGDLREISNAAKCKEYREKNKQKRKAEELNYERILARNTELKRINEKREDNIRKLKEYYYSKLLNGGKVNFNNKKCKKEKKQKKNKEDTMSEASSPMVTIKEEIDIDE